MTLPMIGPLPQAIFLGAAYTNLMRTFVSPPSILRLLSATLLTTLSLGAISPGWGAETYDPCPPAWGTGCEVKAYAVFQRVLNASGYDAPLRLGKEKRTPTRLIYISNQWTDEVGSPAEARTARTRPISWRDSGNPDTYSKVVIYRALFEICRNEDELAFYIAHEITHLGSDDIRHAKAAFARIEKTWTREIMRLNWSNPPKDDRFEALNKQRNAIVIEQESNADREGLRLANVAGYDPKRALVVFEHELEWEIRVNGKEYFDPRHGTIAQRKARALEELSRIIRK